MNRKEQNIAVFEDTMDWIEREPALSGAVQNSIAHTVLYPAQQMPDLPEISSRSKTRITVTPQRTFERRGCGQKVGQVTRKGPTCACTQEDSPRLKIA